MTDSPPGTARDTRLFGILDEYLRALEVGRAPDRSALLARHADVADDLALALRGLDFVREDAPLAATQRPDADVERSLGDYRLLREVGRGGMAVVYEAEQVSLGRRVALKVLPFAAVLDPKQLQRFRNEAQAAAHLQHPHIVPVYSVGCEQGVHYYAMQLVEGQSLAVAIRDMKSGGGATEGRRTPISSHGSHRKTAYIRMAATLGVQAAEALDHAHQLGVVHRDVKPGNLLVDHAGALWVTDFGLAHSMGDVGLTMTGELVGTIRYMSPEQALAKHATVDRRTDVYSLGATLYELLTLEPAFPGDDAHQVIQHIAVDEPVPPRRLNSAVPHDLETVLLKAMSKEPTSRYATAQEMADDLRRVLEDRPVEAKRPGPIGRAAKWGRRHRTLVRAAAVVLVLAVAGLATASVLVWRERARTVAARERTEANLVLALEALDQTYLDAPWESPRVREGLTRDVLEGGLGFYEAFVRQNADHPRAALSMGRAHFSAYLIFNELRETERAEVALEQAVKTLRDVVRRWPGDTRDHSLGLAHNCLGVALLERDGRGDVDEAIRSFREAIRLKLVDPSARNNLGNALLQRGDAGDADEAIRLFREAVGLRPDYAQGYDNLGRALSRSGDVEGAIELSRKAVRLRANHAPYHNNLGSALLDRGSAGDVDEAIRSFRRAVELKADYARGYFNLGRALGVSGDVDGAIEALRNAVRLRANHAPYHNNLGTALRERGGAGDVDEAIRSFRKAVEVKADYARGYINLGSALAVSGDVDGAIEAYREAVRLGRALRSGDVDGAIESSSPEAVRAKAEYIDAQYHLGAWLLRRKRGEDLASAVQLNRDVTRHRPEHAEAHCNLGHALVRLRKYREALPSLQKGHELGSKRPDWKYSSAKWVASAERGAELEGRLDRVLAGETRPRDASERVEFADLLYYRSRYAEAARMFEDAFAVDAALVDDLGRGYRYDAACCASLAAAGGGEDAVMWRGRALEWLRAHLAAREKASAGLAEVLAHWKRDPDLAPVRDHLDDLPAPEREGWKALWGDVDRVLAGALAAK